MKRVMIIGGPGSGKSTLARWLGPKIDVPVFHMDLIHWKEDWVERSAAEKLPLVQAVEARETWVLEGGLSVTYDNRMARADKIIWLDLPVGLRLWRVTKRLFRYRGRNRPDLPKGCVERFHLETVKFYHFIWTTRQSGRDKIDQLVANPEIARKTTRLRTPREVTQFMETFRS